jgi:hypothetical protein
MDVWDGINNTLAILVWPLVVGGALYYFRRQVVGEGRRLFDDVGKYGQLDLVSSTVLSNGTIGLEYRRHR